MAKAVFIASSHSSYLDRPGELYHFPNRYLRRVNATVGDWVIFFAGRRGGSLGYYAVQRVSRIEPDTADPTHSYAVLDRASELSFERTVPRVRLDGRPYETGLPPTGGFNAAAVRLISDADFAAIVTDGLSPMAGPDALPRDVSPRGLGEAPAMFDAAPRERLLLSRALRDASFRRQVTSAYHGRCAISGLELRNGGGRPEVEAAHIRGVEYGGPDVVRNGLALSGTVHWMFDRGLVAVDEDRTILIAKGSIAEDVTQRLLQPDRRLLLPSDPRHHPHPAYLSWHRQNIFKG